MIFHLPLLNRVILKNPSLLIEGTGMLILSLTFKKLICLDRNVCVFFFLKPFNYNK